MKVEKWGFLIPHSFGKPDFMRVAERFPIFQKRSIFVAKLSFLCAKMHWLPFGFGC